MLKKWILSVAMGAIATLLFCQNNQDTLEHSLLWRVSGNNLEKCSYLFGTIHVGDARVFQYGDSVKAAIKESDAVYGEIDLTDISSQISLLPRMMMDKNLSDLVSKDEYALIQKRSKNSPALLMMERMKPFFTLGELTRLLIESDSINVLDMHLQQIGQMMGKEIGGVETLEEQLDAIDQISIESQIEMLLEFCYDYDNQKLELEQLLEAYLSEDLNAMQEYADSEMADKKGAEIEKKLLVDRNEVMVFRLKKLMAEKSLIFAVGALHLPSKDGLINLLRNEGYTVEAIKTNRPKYVKPIGLAPSR